MSIILIFSFIAWLALGVFRLAKADLLKLAWRHPPKSHHLKSQPPMPRKARTVLPRKKPQPDDGELAKYKRLYHQLHNLEQHPSVLPEARDVLIALFAEALSEEAARPGGQRSFLDLETFNAQHLATFLQEEDDRIAARLEDYITRRRNGAPRELFQTLDQAKAWLIQRAPSKLVDGAWLGHIHKIATPFALRPITKNAWQVLSEELGDGDLAKNHAAIYRSLLARIDAHLPEADSAAFIEADFGDDDVETWKCAVAQLLISLFPDEFLPEILGFNLHFECLTWDTVRAARELHELRLDEYYFLLHISIDNSDSGHAAMALGVVVDYLRHVQSKRGDKGVEQAWRGIQVGYLLSRMFAAPEDERSPSTTSSSFSSFPRSHNSFAPELLRIFQAKASAAARLHCSSRVRIGSKKLSEWLDPRVLETPQGGTAFLAALSQTRPWIQAGNSAASRLVREFEWNGKMFGALTESELDVLRQWVDALATPPSPRPVDPSAYWTFVPRSSESPSPSTGTLPDGRLDRPVFSARGLRRPWQGCRSSAAATSTPMPLAYPPAVSTIDVAKLLPLWFAHPCLLENFVSVPIRTCSPTGGAVVRVLRAQRGFAAEGAGVAGMDESRRAHCVDLVAIGLEMARRAGVPPPESLMDVSGLQQGEGFAADMLHWSRRSVTHRDALLGMAWAFTELHEVLASEESGLLSEKTRLALGAMARRERDGLAVCRKEASRGEFEAAAQYAREQIRECLC